MKQRLFPCAVAGLGLMAATSFAGTMVNDGRLSTSGDAFADAIRPISNPTLFDLALPTTNVHPIYLYQSLPTFVNTKIGNLAMGGNLQVYALQFEYALNERLSIVATKDGYVFFNPKVQGLWQQKTGFANLAAGLKYAFVYDRAAGFALSGIATVEVPTGTKNVWQGEGDGAVNLGVSALKMWGPLELAGATGVHLPFDHDLDSTTGFASAHLSYGICKYFTPLVEVNWYRVLDEGDGGRRYRHQAFGLTPGVANFEGGDLVNFGASNGSVHPDQVTAAVGFRSRVADHISLGAAYEVPLTRDNNSLMKNRFTVDAIWNF